MAFLVKKLFFENSAKRFIDFNHGFIHTFLLLGRWLIFFTIRLDTGITITGTVFVGVFLSAVKTLRYNQTPFFCLFIAAIISAIDSCLLQPFSQSILHISICGYASSVYGQCFGFFCLGNFFYHQYYIHVTLVLFLWYLLI